MERSMANGKNCADNASAECPTLTMLWDQRRKTDPCSPEETGEKPLRLLETRGLQKIKDVSFGAGWIGPLLNLT
jgi:hypothetical protein